MQTIAVFVMNGLDNVYEEGAIVDPIEKLSNVYHLTSINTCVRIYLTSGPSHPIFYIYILTPGHPFSYRHHTLPTLILPTHSSSPSYLALPCIPLLHSIHLAQLA